MSTVATSINATLDALLDQLQRRRERVLAEVPSTRRSMRVAESYEQEARVWSLLFERSRNRLSWRAALAAEAYARQCARGWRARAASEDQFHVGRDGRTEWSEPRTATSTGSTA